MAKRRKRGKRRSNPRRKHEAVRRRTRRSNPRRHHRYARRRNPSSGIGGDIAAVLVGGVLIAAAAAGLAFQQTITGQWTGAVLAGGGIALGVVAGMLGYPGVGVGIAAAGVGAGAAQFVTYEVANYETGLQGAQPPSGILDQLPMRGINGINGIQDTLPVHSDDELSQARAVLQSIR